MTEPVDMTIDDAIQAFRTAGHTLPRAAMQWCLDHWTEAAPALVALLSRYADGADRSIETADGVLFALHLCGETAETSAFKPLCRLLHHADATDAALGDGITTTLRHILARTFDGNAAPLQAVIEDAKTDEFIREASLLAMAYLTLTGRIARDEMHAYLRHLLNVAEPRGESYIWAAVTYCVGMFGFTDMVEDVKGLFQRQWVEPMVMHYRHFEADLRQGLEDPAGRAAIENHRLEPFTSAIDELSHWYGFTEQYVRDKAAREERERKARETALAWPEDGSGGDRNPLRHIGRNDPCPCGSGKKFKKCCLGNPELLLPRLAA